MKQFYLVFCAQPETVQDPQPVQTGYQAYEYQHKPTGRLIWAHGPVGVFRADDAEEACKAASRKIGSMGTFFAVEGFPWGVSMVVADAEELGTEPLSTLDQLETKSRDMEKTVGIGTDDATG